MARLEDLARGAQVKGLLPDGPVTILDVTWHGSTCVELTYKHIAGCPHTELVFRDREPSLELVTLGQAWSFDADGGLLRLVSEAYRIRLAHLFDPLLAVRTTVKGRAADARTRPISWHGMLNAFNKPGQFILAIVPVDGNAAATPRYIRCPFQPAPDFGVNNVNYDLEDFLVRGEDRR